MAEPRSIAVNRMIADRAGAAGGPPGGAPAPGAAPGAPAPTAPKGGAEDPLSTAVKLLDAVVFRLSEKNPEAAGKLSTAIDGIKNAVQEIQAAGTKQKPGGGEAAPTPPGAAPVATPPVV